MGSPAGLLTTVAADGSSRSRLSEGEVVRIGDVLGDRYRIVRRIGSGGMGIVYLAEHVDIGKQVAIKILGLEFTHKSRLVDRFMQEARAASLIRHEHIVDITDFGYVGDGVPYYVMEYLEGETLAQRLQRTGPLPWPEARHVVLQICNALGAAHDKGVIHRDMKPDNVFLVERSGDASFVKVLDFGIAKIVAEHAQKNLTQTGMVMGTAAYMSPEQAQSLELDARTDVYAVGIMLYEILTGRVPFDAGGFLGVVAKHLTERVPSMRRVAPHARISAALERVVLRALKKDRDERWASVDELADALRTVGDGQSSPRRAVLAASTLGGLAMAAWLLWPAADGEGDAPSEPAIAAVAADEAGEPEPRIDREPAGDDEADAPPAAASPIAAAEAAESIATAEPSAIATSAVPDAAEPAAITPPGPPDVADPSSPERLADARDDARPTARPHKRRTSATDSLHDRDAAGRIGRGLKKARRRLADCADKYFPLDKVRVKVTISVRADGTVSDVSVADPHGRFPLGRCVAQTIRAVRFPAAREPSQTTRHIVLE